MLIVHNRHARALARVLDALAVGECIARDCATRQAHICDSERLHRVFLAQSRQEAVHAAIFAGAARLLGGKQTAATGLRPALAAYGRRLTSDLDAARLPESLVGLQIVLEDVGKLLLTQLDHALARRGGALASLRRKVLAQETAHHALGARTLNQLFAAGAADRERLGSVVEEYLSRSLEMLRRSEDLFEAFDLEMAGYLDALARDVRASVSGQKQ